MENQNENPIIKSESNLKSVTVKGYPWVGGTAQLSGLVSLVGVFIYGTRLHKNQSEKENQSDEDIAEKEE
ncbi:MAG: hypothetical protein K6U80_03260 [Firmicutes bacterium]|nr:hypothetical protein [Bacillota bacterium]